MGGKITHHADGLSLLPNVNKKLNIKLTYIVQMAASVRTSMRLYVYATILPNIDLHSNNIFKCAR